MNTISSGLTKTKYVPPSQRNSNIPNRVETQKWVEIPKRVVTQKWVEIPKRVIEKKTPEFSLTDTSLFPTLETSVNKNKTAKANSMSFVTATKYEEPKKEEIISEYKPGWVYIRKNKDVIEYKYVPQDNKTMMEQLKNQLKYEEAHDLRILNSLLSRLQWEQDKENITLGDLSLFHNTLSIEERLYEDYIYDFEHRETYISIESDNSVSESENNISLPENK
jgi:hypothetical protein